MRIAVCPGYCDRIGRARSKNLRLSRAAGSEELAPITSGLSAIPNLYFTHLLLRIRKNSPSPPSSGYTSWHVPRHQRPRADTRSAGSRARCLRRCTWPLTTRDSGRLRDIGLSLRAERQEALNHPFASNPPENSAGPRDIQRLAPQALSPCVAPPACGFGGDHTRHLRDSVLPSNRRYIGAECHREPE